MITGNRCPAGRGTEIGALVGAIRRSVQLTGCSVMPDRLQAIDDLLGIWATK
jgi:hypothetical protein